MYSCEKAVDILSQTVSCTLRALFGHLPQAKLGEGGHWTNLGVDALMDVVLLHKVWKTKLKSLAKLDQSNGSPNIVAQIVFQVCLFYIWMYIDLKSLPILSGVI